MAESLEDFLIAIGFEVEGDKATTESDKILNRFRQQSAKAADFVALQFKRAAGLAAGAIGAIAASGAAALHHYVELGSEVGSLSEKLGVGTRELQRLQAATTATGGSADALKDALKTMTVGFQEAATKGSGPFWEGLKLVGVQIEELEGLDAEAQIGLLADALADIKDPADRTATSLKLFGEAGGLELGGLLSKGSKGIRELGDEAERLGIVLDQEAIDGARQLKASFGQLEAVGSVVAARVGEQVAPAFQDAADRALAWVEENDQFIKQDLPAAIEAVIEALGSLIAWTVDVVHEFGQFGKLVKDTYSDVKTFGTELTDRFGPAIEGVTGFLSGMAEGFDTVTSSIGDGIAKLLDYIGVLDDLREVWNSLPFVGESLDEMTARLHGGRSGGRAHRNADGSITWESAAAVGAATNAGGAASFADPDNEARRQAKIINDTIAAALAVSASETATAQAQALISGSKPNRGAARAAGRAALAPKASGGGGAKSAPKASGKGGILDRLGLGSLFEEHAGEGLAGLLGFGTVDHAPAGGGSSPLAGATFVTQEVNTTATVTIELPATALAGLTHGAQADVIAQAVRDTMAEQNRRALDYVQTPVRR